MPLGHLVKSFRSSPFHNSTLTLVDSASCSSESPRWTRMRRRLGPKASLSLISIAHHRKKLTSRASPDDAATPCERETYGPGNFYPATARAVFQQSDYGTVRAPFTRT